MKKRTIKILLLILICSLLMSSVGFASEPISTRASSYINKYSAAITATGSGSLTIEFTITAKSTMDDIGATAVYLYEIEGSTSTLVKTYSYTQYSSMMGHDKLYYSGSLTYAGTSGTKYYALVCLWAGKDDGGDSATKYTSTVTA